MARTTDLTKLTGAEQEALATLVIEQASEIAADITNQGPGEGVDYLLSNGWQSEQITERLREMTRVATTVSDTEAGEPEQSGSLEISCDGVNWLGSFTLILKYAIEDFLSDDSVQIRVQHWTLDRDTKFLTVSGLLVELRDDHLVFDDGHTIDADTVYAITLG